MVVDEVELDQLVDVDAGDEQLAVGEGRDAWLLFPREGAEIVPPERLRSPPRPLTIFVLDGTWGQARRMARTLPQVRDLPVVGLPEGATARWSLRAETVAGGMATVDAVAWLLGALEGELAAEPLERAWQAMSDRTLASRGTPRPGGPRPGPLSAGPWPGPAGMRRPHGARVRLRHGRPSRRFV